MSREIESDKRTQEIDNLVQIQYQKYMQTKKSFLGSGEKLKEKMMKENFHYNNSPSENVTFARLREMNKQQQKYQKLLMLLNCGNFQEALIKINRINKSDSLLQGVKKLIKRYSTSQEPSLQQSLNIVRQCLTKLQKN